MARTRRTLHRPWPLLATALLMTPPLLATTAAAETVGADRARMVAGNCMVCHGAAPAQEIPLLTGLDPDQIVRTVAEFRDGQRHGTIMPRIAKGYDDATIRAAADILRTMQ